MILSFSGDPFLAPRAALRALRAEGFAPHEVTTLGEGLTPDEVLRLASQGGLFGRVALRLDLDEAFTGQAGVKPRNELLAALEGVDPAAFVVAVDSSATPARQKRWRALGRHQHLPTPRYERLPGWIQEELRAHGLRFAADVPQTLADLFGEDLPAIASEIEKVAVLDETLTSERIRALAHRPAARDAFALIEAVVAGEAATSLAIARELLAQGEPPQRVFGALTWQFLLVAKAVALRADGALDARSAATALGAKPFVARRALKIAEALDERRLRTALTVLLEADRRGKSGGDPAWALEGAVLDLAPLFAPPGVPQPAPAGPRAR